MLGERDVDDLIAALNAEKGKRFALRRFRLVKALGAMEDSRAVESLLTLVLTDQSPEVRDAAVVALGRIGDPSAIPALKKALGDPVNRWRAIRSLGLLRDPSSVPWFIGYLHSTHPMTREFAADALGNIGDRAATLTLIETLDDPKIGVRLAAAGALAKLRDPRALEPVGLAHRSARCFSRWYMGKALARLEGEADINSEGPKKWFLIEEKIATPFSVMSILKQALGIRGSRQKRLAEATYIARGFLSPRTRPEALEFLEKAIQEFPDDPEIRVSHASILLDYRPEDVAAEAARAAELAQDDPATLVRAGHLLISRDREAARACATRANEVVQPGFVLMSGLMHLDGTLAALDGEDDLAEEKLRSATASDPDNEPWAGQLAVFLAERGRTEDAVEVLDEALKHVEHKTRLEKMRLRMKKEIAEC